MQTVPQISKLANNIPNNLLPPGVFVINLPLLSFREEPCWLLPPTPCKYSSHKSKLFGFGNREGGGFIIARADASVAAPLSVVPVVAAPARRSIPNDPTKQWPNSSHFFCLHPTTSHRCDLLENALPQHPRIQSISTLLLHKRDSQTTFLSVNQVMQLTVYLTLSAPKLSPALTAGQQH
jgi:hypothetical protein